MKPFGSQERGEERDAERGRGGEGAQSETVRE